MNVQQGQQLLQDLNHTLGFLGWLTQPTLLFQSQKLVATDETNCKRRNNRRGSYTATH